MESFWYEAGSRSMLCTHLSDSQADCPPGAGPSQLHGAQCAFEVVKLCAMRARAFAAGRSWCECAEIELGRPKKRWVRIIKKLRIDEI